jgi:hypothetical protein
MTGYPDKLVFTESQGSSLPHAQSPATFAWTPATTGTPATGFRLNIDGAVTDMGNVTQSPPMSIAIGQHRATVAAYAPADTGGLNYSPESVPLDFIIDQPPPPPGPCDGHPVTIQVVDYTNSVKVGARGHISFNLTNPFPITQVQVRITDQAAGVLIGSQIAGSDLRDVGAMNFNVPRNAASYFIGIYAVDNSNCIGQTTTPRTLTVTP